MIEDHRHTDQVSAIWKYVAVTVIGVLLGGAPAYVSLAVDQHQAVTRKDVDGEIIQLNAPIITSLADLKDQVKDLVGEVHELRAIQK